SKLVTRGRLIVRSDLLQSADSFRPLATPPLLPDYRRLSAEYTLSPDGLQLEFAFTDQEEDILPPFPAPKASGSFTVVCERNFRRIGQVDIKLEGQKGTSRRDLMIRALDMALSKLYAEGAAGGATVNGTPIIWGNFNEDLFSPVVTVSVQ